MKKTNKNMFSVSKKYIYLFIFFTVFSWAAHSPSSVSAAQLSCKGIGIDYVGSPLPKVFDDPDAPVNFTLSGTGIKPNAQYQLHVTASQCTTGVGGVGQSVCFYNSIGSEASASNGTVSFSMKANNLFPGVTSTKSLWLTGPDPIASDGCLLHESYSTGRFSCSDSKIILSQERGGKTCHYLSGMGNSCLESGKPITLNISDITKGSKPYTGTAWIWYDWRATFADSVSIQGGKLPTKSIASMEPGSYKLGLTNYNDGISGYACSNEFNVIDGTCEETCLTEEELENAVTVGPDEFSLCEQIGDPAAQEKCLQCSGGEDGTEGVWTAVGCISKEPEEILGRLIRLGISMGGGVALLMILSAGFTLTISQGDTQKTAKAKEMVTAAVTGLLFIIFSVTILQFIGFSILKIPGFGG